MNMGKRLIAIVVFVIINLNLFSQDLNHHFYSLNEVVGGRHIDSKIDNEDHFAFLIKDEGYWGKKSFYSQTDNINGHVRDFTIYVCNIWERYGEEVIGEKKAIQYVEYNEECQRVVSNVEGKVTYYYFTDGLISSLEKQNESINLTNYLYDEKKRLISLKSIKHATGKVFVFNGGKCQVYDTLDIEGSMTKWTYSSTGYTRKQYDDYGKLVSTEIKDGNVTTHTEVEDGKSYKIVGSTITLDDVFKTKITLNNKGQKISSSNKWYKENWLYNNHGQLVKYVRRSWNFKKWEEDEVVILQYEYDSYGNWIRVISTQYFPQNNYKNKIMFERNINYLD